MESSNPTAALVGQQRPHPSGNHLHIKTPAPAQPGARTKTMSDYDSGDDLLADVNIDTLVSSSKRSRPDDDSDHDQSEQNHVSKRTKVEGSDANLDAIARQILKEKFGYDDFRHEQRSAIRSVLRGENTLVIFPTGAGKSLCYQVNIPSTYV